MRHHLLLIPALVLWSALAHAQLSPAKGCVNPKHRQFDFWIGDWSVYDSTGKVAGRNQIERILDGCALRETWRGESGYRGTSLTMYLEDEQRWHQTWTDHEGGTLLLDGNFEGDALVLRGQSKRGATLHRISWRPIPGPSAGLRQHWEISSDGGKSWRTEFDGRYRRR